MFVCPCLAALSPTQRVQTAPVCIYVCVCARAHVCVSMSSCTVPDSKGANGTCVHISVCVCACVCVRMFVCPCLAALYPTQRVQTAPACI